MIFHLTKKADILSLFPFRGFLGFNLFHIVASAWTSLLSISFLARVVAGTDGRACIRREIPERCRGSAWVQTPSSVRDLSLIGWNQTQHGAARRCSITIQAARAGAGRRLH